MKKNDVFYDKVFLVKFLEQLNIELEYKRLDGKNEELIAEAAKCLAETFAGITVKEETISEPMVQAVHLSIDDFNEFVYSYMKNVVEQGLCYIAINRKNNKIIGVLACEDFDPDEEVPPFTDNLEPMNKICELLEVLDKRFLDTIYYKTDKKIKKNDFVHMFMIGVKSDKLKKEIAKDLVRICQDDAIKRGYKGMFLEATNIKSATLISKYFKFKLVHDEKGILIHTKYAETEHFKDIPPEKSLDCKLFYKALDPEYDI
ncbi:uroporphyrinogen decarboxylase/cobalamine-independent methonine synthase family protein [Vallitalea maricola]|uniref:Uncharacterized protein n=1 Tax=Vallitalea maricola TaxID=3074433 RepID=A0ACB5UIL6_9FIRM|nr:hypothetical protein AN2V17_18280 [Vallitalea sp. AN17-2]